MKYQIGRRQNQRNVHPRQTKKALKWSIPIAMKKSIIPEAKEAPVWTTPTA